MSTAWLDTAFSACRLLGDAAHGRPVSADSLPDEAQLLGFSKVHRIETLISSALRTVGIEEGPYHALHEAASTAAFHQIKNDQISADLLQKLHAAGIDALPLKGAALQAVYPDGWVRTATDTDLYIPQEQFPAACTLLLEAGFTQTGGHDGEHCFQKPLRTVIELHTTLGGYSKKQRQVLDRLSRTPFTVNEHYVYTLFHLYKHFLYAGAGVRLFWDMYCLFRTVTDRICVERWLEELELLPFDRAVQTVCDILFNAKPCPDAMADTIELIFKSGTFGTGETYHAMTKAARSVTHKNRFSVWITDHGFDRVAMTARYPVLKRHLWLYPVCVVRRVAGGILFRQTVWRHAVKTEHAVNRKQAERILRSMNIL